MARSILFNICLQSIACNPSDKAPPHRRSGRGTRTLARYKRPQIPIGSADITRLTRGRQGVGKYLVPKSSPQRTMPSGTGISIKNPAARNNYHKTQQKVRYL